jgi:membrane associated rhomboid family serine protease
LIIPVRVDVPQDQLPIVNWLIIAGAVAVFVWQSFSIFERSAQLHIRAKDYENKSVEDLAKEFGVKDKKLREIEKSAEKPTRIMEDGGLFKKAGEREQFKEDIIRNIILQQYYVWGAIRPYILDGLTLKGLFGYMWLHGGIIHLLGNMLFLWIFGNAICAKIGNLRYIPVYIGMGLISGISHLIFTGGSVLGASGAINGIVGMFLVLFPQNEITCYLILGIIRQFNVSSAWMILFWLVFDIWGAMKGGGGVAYFAHLGGFAGGVILALLMLKFKMLTMERYEKSLLQIIEEYRHPTPPQTDNTSQYYDYLSSTAKERPEMPMVPITPVPFEPKTISSFAPPGQPQKIPLQPQVPKDEFIRFSCACGKRLKMPAKFAGKTGKCPQCNARLKIPG